MSRCGTSPRPGPRCSRSRLPDRLGRPGLAASLSPCSQGSCLWTVLCLRDKRGWTWAPRGGRGCGPVRPSGSGQRWHWAPSGQERRLAVCRPHSASSSLSVWGGGCPLCLDAAWLQLDEAHRPGLAGGGTSRSRCAACALDPGLPLLQQDPRSHVDPGRSKG